MIKRIKYFKEKMITDPIEAASIGLPYLAAIIAVITSIVAVIIFAQEGGFNRGVDLYDIESFKDLFTLGNVSVLTDGFVSLMIYMILGSEIILMLYRFFNRVNKEDSYWWMLKNTVLSFVFSMIFLPLVILLIENIIIIGVFAILIIAAILVFVVSGKSNNSDFDKRVEKKRI